MCMTPYVHKAIPLIESETGERDCIIFEYNTRLYRARCTDGGDWKINKLSLGTLHHCLLYCYKGPSMDSLPESLRDAVDVWAFEQNSFDTVQQR